MIRCHLVLGASLFLCSHAIAQMKLGLQNPDTAQVQPDTTALQLVTSVADSVVTSPDSTRAQDIHPQDSPGERGFLIRTSDGVAELRIRGSVRLNGILDFKGLQNQSTFSTFEIPVGEATSDVTRFQMDAGQRRLGLEAPARRASEISSFCFSPSQSLVVNSHPLEISDFWLLTSDHCSQWSIS